MTPEALRALADTVAWQDRTDLHGAMLAAADEIERLRVKYRVTHDYKEKGWEEASRLRSEIEQLKADLDAANALIALAHEVKAETLRQAAERSRAVREDLDLATGSDRTAPVFGAEERAIEGGGG